ncbi:exonuclease GOR [Caerostris extrusa]|uniref:Exonuclease GOR n=1 Tax=Caerostris extrusa TaxID=172846 RepID=A0AAV4T2S4_CAEEX|nr:exonuclease GOR [Caerostris extrusa]
MTHETVIDTSCVFPHKERPPLKNSLKYLAEIYLQKNIQKGYTGHNSVEDARTCMELMLYKIYTETRTTFVPRPIIPGIIPKTFQSINQSYPKFAVVPFNIVHVMPPPTFICFHVNVSPPFSPFPRLQAIQMKSFYPGEESMAWKSALKRRISYPEFTGADFLLSTMFFFFMCMKLEHDFFLVYENSFG